MNRKQRRAARKQAPGPSPNSSKPPFGHHQAGQLAEADRLYRQVLAVDPDHVDTLHHLGVLARQAGRNDLAINLLGKAVALDPDLGPALNNLATILLPARRLRRRLSPSFAGRLPSRRPSRPGRCSSNASRDLRVLPPGDDHAQFLRARVAGTLGPAERPCAPCGRADQGRRDRRIIRSRRRRRPSRAARAARIRAGLRCRAGALPHRGARGLARAGRQRRRRGHTRFRLRARQPMLHQ